MYGYWEPDPPDEREIEIGDRVKLVRHSLWAGALGTVTAIDEDSDNFVGVTFDGIGLVWCEPKDLVEAPELLAEPDDV